MLFQQEQVCLLGSFQQFNLFLSSLPSSPKLVPQLCLFSPINRALIQKWPLYYIINALPFVLFLTHRSNFLVPLYLFVIIFSSGLFSTFCPTLP